MGVHNVAQRHANCSDKFFFVINTINNAHTRPIDPNINDALRIVTGCLRPTTVDNLPILAAIQSAELRCNEATLPLVRRAMKPGHLLHSALT